MTCRRTALDADGRHLTFGPRDLGGLRARAQADADSYAAWQAQLQRLAGALHPVLSTTPPRLGNRAWRDRATLLGLGLGVRRLGRRDMRELLRIGGMCVHDLLEEHFESAAAQGRAGARCRARHATSARARPAR